MEANAPGHRDLDIQYGGGDQAKSADIAKAIIAANPDLKGIYGSNEGSAIGVVQGRAGERPAPGITRGRLRLRQGPDRRDPRRH